MAGTQSNVNLNSTLNIGQTGVVASSIVPGLIRAVVLVPVGTTIPAASMTDPVTFAAYVKGFLQNNSYGSQWFGINKLTGFKNSTEKDSVWKTAPYSINVFQYPHNYEFNYLQSIGNFIEITGFQNCQGRYDYFLIDQNGNWQGTYDTSGLNGLKAFTNQQFWVGNRQPATDKEGEMYPIMLQLASPNETNGGFKMYQAYYSSDSMPGLENVILEDQSMVLGTPLGGAYTATTDLVITGKMGQDSLDLVKTFGAAIVSNTIALVATDLTSSTTLTISSITTGLIVVGTQSYYYLIIVLSGAPTATHKVQVALASPSIVLPLIPALNGVTAIISAGVNGSNCAIKTF